MPNPPELVFDLDALLAMSPAELGPRLLWAAESMLQDGKFYTNDLLDSVHRLARNRQNEARDAMREGLKWLDYNGFTAPADTIGFLVITPKGSDFLHPPVEAPRPAGSEATPFDRFEARQRRRLQSRLHAVDVELNHLHGEAIKAGAADGNRAIFPKLAAVEREAQEAVDAVLTEASALAANRGETRSLWVEETARRARSVLVAHVEGLYSLNWRMRPEMLLSVRASIDSSRSRSLVAVNGEVDDFAAGIWQPTLGARRNGPASVAEDELTPGDAGYWGVENPDDKLDGSVGQPDHRAAFATATGANEIPMPLRSLGPGPPGRVVTVGGQQYEISGVGQGASVWRFIARDGRRMTGPQFDALALADRQELAEHVQSHLRSLDGMAARAGGFNSSPFNTTPFNDGQRPTAAAPSGPPPDVPVPGPALIEPEWADGRLTLPKRLPTNDLRDDAVVNLLAAVRAGFVHFIEALAQSGTNFHPAARKAIEGVPELLSGAPDQVRVFQMGHAVEHLEALQPVADEELPAALRVQYRTLVGQLRRLVERFPGWRALTSMAQAEPLTAERDQQAVPLAREVVAALSTEAAGEVVNADIPEVLSTLADAAEAASGAERSLLNFDLVASVNQIMTVFMRPVVYCWREVGGGAWTATKALPRKFGAGAVTWGSGTVLAIAGLYVGAGPLAVVAAHLAATYPTLAWLQSVAEFLKFVSTLKA